MTTVIQHLNDIHGQIDTDDKVMSATRSRRDATLAAARSFGGVRYSYKSGSVAMGVVISPVSDADGGIVLDRRSYPRLGPDGDGDLPADIVSELHDHIGPIVREQWPDATVHDMKRGVTVRFHEAVVGDQDPYVDVVVAMERREVDGLWIPNLTANRWDPSDPEQHVTLMNAGTAELQRLRTRVVRLAKAWNKQHSEPALSSFNIVALALESVTDGTTAEDQALFEFFENSVRSLRAGCTDDPAHVSEPIKLPLGKDTAIERLCKARDRMGEALDATSDNERLAALHAIFWKFLPEPAENVSKRAIADALRSGAPRISTATGTAMVGAMKPTRAYGGRYE